MRSTSLLLAGTFLAGLLCLTPASAEAYTLSQGGGSSGAVSAIGAGVKELGLDNILLINYDKVDETSTFRLSYLGGASFRYFLKTNLAVTAHLQALYRKNGDSDITLGGMVGIGGAYYVSLGHGLFFSPGLIVGGYFGNKEIDMGTGVSAGSVVLKESIYGGMVRVKMGLVFYAGRSFNLHAGPEFVFLFGSLAPEEGEKLSTFTMEGALSVGFSYVF
ncbi:MAG: hypothetical protein JRH20_28315 [Deltaproteobacteria bacterium]|nr:hypothetical protein [Deltaproteobacteria bacterium]